MGVLSNLRIRTKILLGFFLVAVISVIIGVIGIYNLNKVNDKNTQLYQKMTVPFNNLYNTTEAFQKIRVNLRDMIMSSNPAEYAEYEENIKNNKAIISKNLEKVQKTLLTDNGRETIKNINNSLVEYEKVADQIISLSKDNNDKEAISLLNGDGAKVNSEVENNMAKLTNLKINLAQNTADNTTTTAKNARYLMIFFILIGVIFAFIIGLIIAKSITKPVSELVGYADRLALGDINMEIESKTKDEIGILMGSFKNMIENISENAIAAQKISRGDLSVEVKAKSKDDVLAKSMIQVVESLNNLEKEAEKLTNAAIEGKLSTRGDVEKFQGDYKKIVQGVNSTLDAVIGPLNVAADYVDKISKGNMPVKITDNYNGDFNTIKNNLNICIDSINLLVSDAANLAQAAVEGKLSTRADETKHDGDYRKIVEGVNKTLDAVIEPVKEASAVLQYMSDGNLKVKVMGDYKGDHADIKNALNDTIDALYSYISEISYVLSEMSNCNFEISINNEYKGDFAEIKDALNLIIESFNEVFTEINKAADQVSTGSSQVSDGSQALSQGTTEQASAIEELTASIGEVAAQTKQNAANATQANQLALNAKDGAALGNTHMKEMLKSMDEINESSTNISKIIKVIDDIAFQTNILALNAAVEAARAGQHGKGFAVVAEEVRNLAARSASAAKETTDLIEGSINKVELGTKIANNTADALDAIVEGVSKAAELVGEIAIASNEQATAISQVNRGVEQVSDVVQTNSATAEESAAASEELSSQASTLKNMIKNFKLRKDSLTFNNGTEFTDNQSFTHSRIIENKNKPKISLGEFGKY